MGEIWAENQGLLRTAAALLGRYWWRMIAVAALAYAGHDLLLQVAVFVSQRTAVGGLLVFALLPLVPLAALIAMLMMMRRHQHSEDGPNPMVAALASVLVPFLVVYQSQDLLWDDLSEYLYSGLLADCGGGFIPFCESTTDIVDRVPPPTSPLVLTIVAVAFVLRMVVSRFTERDSLWVGKGAQRIRTGLRLIVGYAEAVWIVLGVSVVGYAIEEAQQWWQTRRIGVTTTRWWDQVKVQLPQFGAWVDWLVGAIGSAFAAVGTGVIVPISWLAIGIVVFGISAASSVSDSDVVNAVRRENADAQRRRRLGSLASRVPSSVVVTAWHRLADYGGRFGALFGGLAMIVRARFTPILMFCLLYTALNTGLPYVVFAIARGLFQNFDYGQWTSAFLPLNAIASIATLCFTTPLLVAYSDSLLTHYGADSQLRLAPSARIS